MTIAGFAVFYICIWWLLFYMALPIGTKRDFEVDGVGAPSRPRLRLKALIVTAITTVILLVMTWAQIGTLLSDYVNGR